MGSQRNLSGSISIPKNFRHVSLFEAPSVVNQPACVVNISPNAWNEPAVGYLFTNAITVYSPDQNSWHVRSRMVAFKWREGQLLVFEFPFVRFVWWCHNVVASDGKEWVTCFWSPGIKRKRNLSRNILAKRWVGINVMILIQLTWSSSLTSSSTTFARVKISLRIVVWWGISACTSDGQEYVNRRWNEPRSTSWNAYANAIIYISIS